MLWSSASLAPTQHIYIHDDKLVCEHYRDCNGNSSLHVQGRRQLDLVLLLSGICNTTLTCIVIHMRMHIAGRFKGYCRSVHMANYQPQDESC